MRRQRHASHNPQTVAAARKTESGPPNHHHDAPPKSAAENPHQVANSAHVAT